jgi:hypothetical protein
MDRAETVTAEDHLSSGWFSRVNVPSWLASAHEGSNLQPPGRVDMRVSTEEKRVSLRAVRSRYGLAGESEDEAEGNDCTQDSGC